LVPRTFTVTEVGDFIRLDNRFGSYQFKTEDPEAKLLKEAQQVQFIGVEE